MAATTQATALAASGGGEATLDLTIGDLIPLTGDLSDFGPPGDKAANLAVDKINEAIQEVGADHTVTLKTEDDQTSDQAGVSAARKLVGDGASCIAGSWASSVTIPVARSVSLKEGVLEISPASTSDEITGLDDPDGLINRTAPPDSFQGPTLADAIAKDLGGAEGKTVNIGARNDSYGTGLAKTFSDAWEAQGGTIGQEVIYDPEAATYDSEAAKITSGNPDATVIIDFPETFAKVGPALVRTGNYDPSTTWGTDGLASSSLPKDVGTDVDRRLPRHRAGDAGQGRDHARPSTRPTRPPIRRTSTVRRSMPRTSTPWSSATSQRWQPARPTGTDMAATVRDVSAPPGDPFTWEELPEAIKALRERGRHRLPGRVRRNRHGRERRRNRRRL